MAIDDVEGDHTTVVRLANVDKVKLAASAAGFGFGWINYEDDSIELDATAAVLFSLPAHVAIARHELHARFHPECRRRLDLAIEAVLEPRGDGIMVIEHRVVRPDGSVIWLAARKQVEFSTDASGRRTRATSGLLAVRDVTRQKLADDKLRVSEIRYRRLFEAAHDGVLLLDPVTAKIVDANPFMTRLLGYSHDQLVGKELFEIGLLQDRAMSQNMFNKLKIDRQVRYEHLPLESNQGRHREVEVVANVYDEGGYAIIQCNIRDITGRKLAEAAALQNARLFSTLIDQAPSGVYVIDSEFRILQVNRLAAPVFASIEPVLGREFSEVLRILWGVEIGRQLERIFRHTLQTGERYANDAFTARRADLGTLESYEWEAQRVILADGSYGIGCYFNDITARTIAQDAVVEREAHVRSILDNTQSFIGLMTTDGTLIEINAPALAATGLERNRVVGRKIWETASWRQDAAEVARLKDAVARSANGEVVRYDLAVDVSGQPRMDIDFMLAPVRDATGTVTLLVPSGVDITERKRSMRHVQMLMNEVNHRAMNLLGVVQAVARQTARGSDPTTFVTRLNERIGSLAASQDLLVQNEWQGVEVTDLVAAQLSHYKDLIGNRVVIIGPPARLTPSAAQGIGMALHELATNAGKYGALSNDAGRVIVTWALPAADPAHFEMSWTETEGPGVEAPKRQGFGHKVIGSMVEAAVNGRTVVDFRRTGLVWTLHAPATDILEQGRGEL